MAASAIRQKAKLSWLDLRGSGLSAMERLCLEEALLRHDPKQRCWAILGSHEPTSHRILQNIPISPHIRSSEDPNRSCIIVMGIGGKPLNLLNIDLVRKDGVQVVKRFSGGGTVVLDHSSLWTTFIGRTELMPDVEPFPRPIMQWSADRIFGPAFAQLKRDALQQESPPKVTPKRPTLIVDTKSCSAAENSGRVVSLPGSNVPLEIPDFALRENDYVLGERKMGGNAQSLIQGGWLHHTSFLWDYVDENMEYLSIPSKRPDYRGDRSHDEFLVKLKLYYGQLRTPAFFSAVKDVCTADFDLEEVTVHEAMEVVSDELGGMQKWFDTKCRTKIITV